MRVDNSQPVSKTDTFHNNSTVSSDTTSIGKALTQKPEVLNVPDFYFGQNVDAMMGASDDAPAVPGFEAHEVQFILDDGQEFSVNLYVSEDLIPEQADKMAQKFMRVMCNLSPEFLDEFKNECKHVLLVPENEINSEAWAQAVGQTNQMFISVSKMLNLSDQKFAETLIHETGHLVDQTNGFTGKASKAWNSEFNQLKGLITADLGFDAETKTLTSASEMFADYYLNNQCEVSEEHRSKLLFKLLNQYSNDVEKLSPEELQAKYGEKTDSIISLTKAWGKLKYGFDYFLGNVSAGDVVERMNESAKPLNFKQLLKLANKY